MDSNIQTRLKEASQNCLDAFVGWENKKQDSKAQEALHAAIHELRKVSSRLEIELAMSERDQLSSKPLPIPAHRSNMKSDPGPILDGTSKKEKKGKDGPSLVQTKNKRRRPAKKNGANGGE